MAWENRGNNRYYYRKERVGKRVISSYWGSGDVANAVANLDMLRRQESQCEREMWRIERQNEDATDQAIDEMGDLIRNLTKALLLKSGFHTHKRQWRKRRVNA